MINYTNIAELRKKYRSENYVAFSLDIDWASEVCIQETVDYFMENEIPLTVFCTHPSQVLNARREDPYIELGIHPNYCEGSSQGNTLREITDYCMNLVPDARCVRGHRWYSSNDMYDLLLANGICFDSNECSMMDVTEPYIHRSGLLRFPVFFEDGALLWSNTKPDFEANGKEYFAQVGLKVLNLHPIHFALNSPTQQFYRQIGDTLSREEYTEMSEETMLKLRHKGLGMREYIMNLVDYIHANQIQVVSMGQVFEELEYERKRAC